METLIIILIITVLLIAALNLVISIPVLIYELKENKRMGYDTRETIPHYILFIILSFIPIYNITLLIELIIDYRTIRKEIKSNYNGSN